MQKLERKPLVTYLLVSINLLVFGIMTISGGTTNVANLIRFGANFQPLLLAGQWYRLVTPMFIHIGFEHLLLNMITLYFCGIFLEKMFGHWRFLVIYIIAGISGNLLSAGLGPNTVSAGASTAIFGMFGAFIVLGLIYRETPYFQTLGRQFGVLIILNLFFAFWPGSGVDILGHIGGLIGGFLMASFLGTPFGKIKPLALRWGALTAELGFILIVGWWLIYG